MIVDVISAVFIAVGSLFCLIGGVGILRLPDFYTRTHGASLTDTFGAGMILLGLMVQAGLSLVLVKLIMIQIFILLTSPTATHALAKAAFAMGLKVETDKEGRHVLPD